MSDDKTNSEGVSVGIMKAWALDVEASWLFEKLTLLVVVLDFLLREVKFWTSMSEGGGRFFARRFIAVARKQVAVIKNVAQRKVCGAAQINKKIDTHFD